MTISDKHFHFHKLGLHSNPFRVLTAEEWADVAVVPAAIETAFNAGDNLLILGERGRGKSTLLRTLIQRLQWQHLKATYERLPTGKWHYATNIHELDAFAPDEAQRLALWEWPTLLSQVKRGMRLIMGSHRNDKRLFHLSGINITVFDLNKYNTRQHLEQVLQRRLAYFAYDDLHVSFADSAIDYLWNTYADNLRAIENHLYPIFQELDELQIITDNLLLRCRL